LGYLVVFIYFILYTFSALSTYDPCVKKRRLIISLASGASRWDWVLFLLPLKHTSLEAASMGGRQSID
jgi:hypothetical protein